jgi:hypothetical protein
MADDHEPEMTIRELKIQVDSGFERVDQRFEWVDQRFEQVDRRFEQVDRRFDQVDRRFTGIDERFEALEKRIAEEHATTRRHFDIVAERLEGHFRLLAARGDVDHQRIENHETRIRTLEKRRR